LNFLVAAGAAVARNKPSAVEGEEQKEKTEQVVDEVTNILGGEV
jgi:hypothetical protein